uniref:Uncharacterized protein n=1 Tax=Hanusia phi TaxID=3032 RepID=A0A7S0ENM7_9CRYP|mmetsp:Transcript_27216/g.61804  ORF Transcript_27216/g.61804 Transcript_27216/m.61804 type:complete len:270 (+) Transcript_27216:1-810(+)
MAGVTGRMEALWRGAHVVKDSSMKRRMLIALRETASCACVKLDDSVMKRFCTNCSTYLRPGDNCTFRLVSTKHKKKKLTEARGEKIADGEIKERAKRLAMRTWFDGKGRGRHSNKRNELVCKCNDCGYTLLWGGSDPEFVQERRKLRGIKRRGQRFRDNEKAEASLRIEQARSVISKEGLRVESNDETPSKRVLPPTLSSRAEAVLDSSYGMHGKKMNSPGFTAKRPVEKNQTPTKNQKIDSPAKQDGKSTSQSGNKGSLYDMLQNILG